MSMVTRKISLLLAVCVVLFSFLIVGQAFADTFIKSTVNIKFKEMSELSLPSTVSIPSTRIPLPAHKPDRADSDIQISNSKTSDISSVSEPQSFSEIQALRPKGMFSNKQARLYRKIFKAQREGDLKFANKKIAQLNDPLLLGHVLAERYLHPSAPQTSYQELQKWMALYADHPQAKKIYALAMTQKPRRAKTSIVKPSARKIIAGNLVARLKQGKVYRTRNKRTPSQQARVQKLTHAVRKQVEKRSPTLALNILSSGYAVQFMDDAEYDRLSALIASGYLYAGKLALAQKLSDSALNRSGGYVPLAGWVKGLVAWQNKNYEGSARAFEAVATSPYSSGWMISAAAYWASRANERAGNTALVDQWLSLSATYPRTFYGLIAMRALGKHSNFNWSIPSLTRAHVQFIEGGKKGERAAALIKIGRVDLAEDELVSLHPSGSVSKQSALFAYAHHYNLPALSMRLANAYTSPKGDLYDAALYPVSQWEPKSGYRVDRALIHAIVRQESRFRVGAANPSGATGLMQLMPATANYISGKDIYADADGRYQLKNPSVNLEIGQAYVEKLLKHKAVGKDLLSLAMAYNAGPGNLSKWKSERTHIDDPLMFIETIPFNETRAFVERVLSNYWIYRMQMHQKTPTLDAVANGKWARYAAQDNALFKFAEAGD